MVIAPKKTIVLSDRLLRSWVRCKRKAWLDSHGDRRLRNWTAHQRLQLDHQQKSFSALIKGKPGLGIQGCKDGNSGVFGLKIKMELTSNLLVEVKPALLQKTTGQSIWGDYSYRPVIARQGKRTTRELRLYLALNSLLLEQVQEFPVPKGITVSQNSKGLEIDQISINVGLKNQLIFSLEGLKKDLKKEGPPPITKDRKKCIVCSWQKFCGLEAKSQGDLSQVNGIGQKRRDVLQSLGINTIKDLANTNPEQLNQKLVNLSNQNQGLAKNIIKQAKCQLSGQPERLINNTVLPELESAPGVILYDIESDSDIRQDFLHGFICIKHNNNGEWDIKNATYHPILMLYQESEKKRWGRLKRKINNYPDWPILHYGETELISIRKMALNQSINKEELIKLEKRFIDIHKRVKLNWLLPVQNYGLKDISSWTGFQWKQKNPDGAMALLWWRQWKGNKLKRKKNLSPLKKIFIYNRDDCMATWSVVNWLLTQDRINQDINTNLQN